MKNSVVVAVSTTSLVSGRKLKAHEGIRHAVFFLAEALLPIQLHRYIPLHPGNPILHPSIPQKLTLAEQHLPK